MEDEGSNHVIEVKDTARRQMMRDAWRLVKPDLDIGGEIVGLWLLLVLIVLNLGNAYISVRIKRVEQRLLQCTPGVK